MAEPKTKQTDASVAAFLKSIGDEKKRKDCEVVSKMMSAVTGCPAKMWGKSIVGFGSYGYKYQSGRTGSFMLCGFSPRKQNLTIYIISGFSMFAGRLEKLGKFRTGKSCLYVKSLADIDQKELKGLIGDSVRFMRTKYATAKPDRK